MYVSLAAVAVGIIAVVSVVGWIIDRKNPAPQMPTSVPGPAEGSAPAVDLSTMTPLEAADRLFNRVMAASEAGNTEEALRFAPMAIQAYGRVETLDGDAHYHLGRIYAIAGDLDGTRKEIGILRQFAPDHLLAFVLEHLIAEATGDADGAARAIAGFAAAYDQEMKSARPEYAAHGVTVEKFREMSGKAPASQSAPVLSASSDRGAQIFTTKCAMCHGNDAAGSDRGPPLVHKIYEPSHHDDEAFYRAVEEGTPAHHWEFGDMPPVTGVSRQDVAQIVVHVRALQAAKGIQ